MGFKVICIDDRGHLGGKHPTLKYGEIYEPVGEDKNVDGVPCYEIETGAGPSFSESGKSNGKSLYRKSRFIPLSSIDETTFERKYNKELV